MNCPLYIRTLIILSLLVAAIDCQSQTDPEFGKGFIFYARLHSGMVTDFHASPDLFVGGLQAIPQITVVPHKMRAGAIAGTFFTDNRIHGEFGPVVTIKLKTFYAKLQGATVGSFGNLQLQLDHLWGTGRHRLLGGGIIFDAGNIITTGITGHRDYKLKNWWFQCEIGIRISKKKRNPVI